MQSLTHFYSTVTYKYRPIRVYMNQSCALWIKDMINSVYLHWPLSHLYLCILFLTLKYNIYVTHMGAALAELCLLGNKTQHFQVRYIDHRCGIDS